MTLRYECDDPEFAGAFVEYRQAWSRAQIAEFWDSTLTLERQLDLMRRKIVACCLPVLDGEPITDPAELTEERTGAMDLRLWRWFVHSGIAVASEVHKLGEALGRPLWVSPEKSMATPVRPMNSLTPGS